MANEFATSDLVAKIALADFHNNNSMVVTASRAYTGQFGTHQHYTSGDTINIRRPNFASVQFGNVTTPEDMNDSTVPLVVDQHYNASRSYNSVELSLDIDPNLELFQKRYITPMVQEMVHKLETNLLLRCKNEFYYSAGTPGAQLNSYAAFLAARTKMRRQAIDINPAYAALELQNAQLLRNSQQNAFNDVLNDDISFYSRLGNLGGIDMFENEAVPFQTAGSAAGTPVVDGAVTSGNQISISGLTPLAAGVFNNGDTIRIAGVQSVNPIGRASTGDLMEFSIVGDYAADGAGEVTLTVKPEIISDVNNSRRNVSNPIADASSVSIVGAGLSFPVNLVYAPDAVQLAIVPLAPLGGGIENSVITDPKTNISLRVAFGSDITNNLNLVRLDLLWGATIFGEYGVQLFS